MARRQLRKRDTAIFRCTFCAFERQAVPVAREPYFDLFPVRLLAVPLPRSSVDGSPSLVPLFSSSFGLCRGQSGPRACFL